MMIIIKHRKLIYMYMFFENFLWNKTTASNLDWLQGIGLRNKNPSCADLTLDYIHRESKKTRHQTFGHNFTNYYPIFNICH